MFNLRRIAISGMTLLLAACGGGGGSKDDGGVVVEPPVVTITVSPTTAQLQPQGTQQFSCTVTGSTNTQCTWSVEGTASGTVSSSGLYTAPATAGTYQVVATAVANQGVKATATVQVAAGGGQGPQGTTPWVTGYYLGYFWDQMYPPQEVDMTAMTHLVFARLAPGGGSLGGQPGEVREGAGTAHQRGAFNAPDPNLSVEEYLVKRAHDANVKALVMIGGVGDGHGFLRSTADPIRPTFVKNLVDYLVAHDYDGIDLDWEDALEGWEAEGISHEEAIRRLKALITELRAEANSRPRYRTPNQPVIITFPGYAVSINFLQPGGRVSQWQADVANMVDQYNLMSYGIGTAWNGNSWNSWFSSPIFGATGNTPIDLDSSIKAYVATGVPRSKIGIGIGFYGIYYGPSITGPRQSTEGNSIFEVDDVALAYNQLDRMGYLSNGTYQWDDVAKAAYRTYASPGFVPSVDPRRNPAGFLSYENDQSIAAKGQWVRETGVGGTILWAVNYGYLRASNTNPLLTSVKQHFLQRQ